MWSEINPNIAACLHSSTSKLIVVTAGQSSLILAAWPVHYYISSTPQNNYDLQHPDNTPKEMKLCSVWHWRHWICHWRLPFVRSCSSQNCYRDAPAPYNGSLFFFNISGLLKQWFHRVRMYKLALVFSKYTHLSIPAPGNYTKKSTLQKAHTMSNQHFTAYTV